MKKVLLFSAVVAGLAFTSCSKKTDCECTNDGKTTTTSFDEAEKEVPGLTQDSFEALCNLGTDCKLV